jgi:TrmH family RNA methyltransferase
LRQNRDYRYDHQSLVIEGVKLVREVGGHLRLKTLLVQDETLIPKGVKADETLVVTEAIMNKISGLHSPEGIIAEVAMPAPSKLKGKRILAFDGVSDPGNVGALLRTALALGWDGAFILEDSCDPFNEKAIRSARGATFKLPLAWGNWEQLQMLIKDNQLSPIVADLEGESLDTFKSKKGVLLVLGNEGHGPTSHAKELCKPVTIPMPGEMESLNVSIAGAIMMYTLGKKD